MNAHITLLCDTHTATEQEIMDIKCVFQSYYMKKYILIHFEIQKKLIVVGLFLLLAEFCLSQASFGRRILKQTPAYTGSRFKDTTQS